MEDGYAQGSCELAKVVNTTVVGTTGDPTQPHWVGLNTAILNIQMIETLLTEEFPLEHEAIQVPGLKDALSDIKDLADIADSAKSGLTELTTLFQDIKNLPELRSNDDLEKAYGELLRLKDLATKFDLKKLTERYQNAVSDLGLDWQIWEDDESSRHNRLEQEYQMVFHRRRAHRVRRYTYTRGVPNYSRMMRRHRNKKKMIQVRHVLSSLRATFESIESGMITILDVLHSTRTGSRQQRSTSNNNNNKRIGGSDGESESDSNRLENLGGNYNRELSMAGGALLPLAWTAGILLLVGPAMAWLSACSMTFAERKNNVWEYENPYRRRVYRIAGCSFCCGLLIGGLFFLAGSLGILLAMLYGDTCHWIQELPLRQPTGAETYTGHANSILQNGTIDAAGARDFFNGCLHVNSEGHTESLQEMFNVESNVTWLKGVVAKEWKKVDDFLAQGADMVASIQAVKGPFEEKLDKYKFLIDTSGGVIWQYHCTDNTDDPDSRWCSVKRTLTRANEIIDKLFALVPKLENSFRRLQTRSVPSVKGYLDSLLLAPNSILSKRIDYCPVARFYYPKAEKDYCEDGLMGARLFSQCLLAASLFCLLGASLSHCIWRRVRDNVKSWTPVTKDTTGVKTEGKWDRFDRVCPIDTPNPPQIPPGYLDVDCSPTSTATTQSTEGTWKGNAV